MTIRLTAISTTLDINKGDDMLRLIRALEEAGFETSNEIIHNIKGSGPCVLYADLNNKRGTLGDIIHVYPQGSKGADSPKPGSTPCEEVSP